jgi:hypothetical protein
MKEPTKLPAALTERNLLEDVNKDVASARGTSMEERARILVS